MNLAPPTCENSTSCFALKMKLLAIVTPQDADFEREGGTSFSLIHKLNLPRQQFKQIDNDSQERNGQARTRFAKTKVRLPPLPWLTTSFFCDVTPMKSLDFLFPSHCSVVSGSIVWFVQASTSARHKGGIAQRCGMITCGTFQPFHFSKPNNLPFGECHSTQI